MQFKGKVKKPSITTQFWQLFNVKCNTRFECLFYFPFYISCHNRMCRLNFSRYLVFRYTGSKDIRPNGITWMAYIHICPFLPSKTLFPVHKSLYIMYTTQHFNYILSICLSSNSLSFKLFQARSISSFVGGFFFCFDAVIFL